MSFAPPSRASDDGALGMRLRALRRGAGLSLSELAKRADVAIGTISQIERGLANPSIRILEQLRVALDVPLTTLLEGDEPTPEISSSDAKESNIAEFVRRSSQRPQFSVSAGGLIKELLTPHGHHDLQFMIISLPPGSNSEEVLIGPGEKAGLVLEGEIRLTVGNRCEVLIQGDSFQFSSVVAHRIDNRSGSESRVLWIMNTRPPIPHF
ncbi:DNA-binding protein [Caballeronia sordidicola]|uniref:DNA-binding protein n=2 Tax=Caballeronia sordidicola TaxID=196367 RepID=A0A158HP46_CABSO|nr:DNA-binding protein [Caballeronia sordidicola]